MPYTNYILNLPGDTILPRILFQKQHISGAAC